MSIYTGSGDGGLTGLFSGERISKADVRIRTSGSVDELNSILGALITELPATQTDLIQSLRDIQTDLLQIGAWISTTPGSPASSQLQSLDLQRVSILERGIDELQDMLPRLDRFILPGGHISGAWAHIARSVCRRCESHTVQLLEHEKIHRLPEPYQTILRYLNRLSDYLFVVARYCNQLHNQKDVEWQG